MRQPRQLSLRLGDCGARAKWESVLRTAQNPAASAHELERALTEPMWTRLALAANPAAPADVVCRLALDESPVVRRRAARHRAIPREALVRLLRDPDDLVRVAAVEALRKFPAP